jgi:hypothetical protein
MFNFVFAEDATEKRELTIKFFEQLPKGAQDVFISEEVVREISKASEPKRTLLEDLLRRVSPLLLEIDIEVEELAERYLREGIIPERYRGDALHIAAAVVNEIEVIISWNFEHIVKLKTRTMVNGVNRLLGYNDIEICSPEEV